jgi:hypothetical protein
MTNVLGFVVQQVKKPEELALQTLTNLTNIPRLQIIRAFN